MSSMSSMIETHKTNRTFILSNDSSLYKMTSLKYLNTSIKFKKFKNKI